MFQMNNETVNIWTHVIGFVYFFSCLLYDLAYFLPLHNAGAADYFVFVGTLLCFQVSYSIWRYNNAIYRPLFWCSNFSIDKSAFVIVCRRVCCYRRYSICFVVDLSFHTSCG